MWSSQGQGQDGQMRWPLAVWGHWVQICLFQDAENNSEEKTDTSALITMMEKLIIHFKQTYYWNIFITALSVGLDSDEELGIFFLNGKLCGRWS